MDELGRLLQELEPSSSHKPLPVLASQTDNQLVQVRLGIAGSLYTALRCRHAAAAAHSLRVALTSSAWAASMGLSAADRDAMEVAALLHDVGMISLPDQVMLKPGPLVADETRLIEHARAMSVEILRCACCEPAVLEIVEHVGAWYDGFKGLARLVADQIPLGARIITIVEAFDAMTTDQVFRPAMSQERAARELFEYSGTQFDPELVKQFVPWQANDLTLVRHEVAQRWLRTLDAETVNSYWELNRRPRLDLPAGDASVFQGRLLDHMHDAVLFVDAGMRVVEWNHGAERLTGVTASSVLHHRWTPGLLRMRNEKGDLLADDDCPIGCAIQSGVQSLRRLAILGRNGRSVSVDSHAIPVTTEDGTALGAILLLHDASPQASLEERCQTLHEKATRDPLTQVSNRAEFDRVHEAFVRRFKDQGAPCSLIICDLDLFKQVNDKYGHQAGDEAIKSLATLLKNACQPGDLVARYGGEEFVMLCAGCDNATAARRAEEIRAALGLLAQPKMDGRSVTASFGVTEVQPGDSAETMLRRADRGLLMAKAKGRNVVVQLGAGSSDEAEGEGERRKRSWFGWRRSSGPALLLEQDLITPVPIKVAVEKLRGFVADHCASIVSIDGSAVVLEIDDNVHPMRRRADRPMIFSLELRFEEEVLERANDLGSTIATSRTKIHVAVRPRKNRDRRRADVGERAREVLASFRSYLMATTEDSPPAESALRRAKSILAPWLAQR